MKLDEELDQLIDELEGTGRFRLAAWIAAARQKQKRRKQRVRLPRGDEFWVDVNRLRGSMDEQIEPAER